ncbi:VOC family protein [Microbacterium aurugineum]
MIKTDSAFSGGRNIALKVPPHRYEATLAFYRDVLRLPEVAGPTGDATGFVFGPCNLWVDNCPGLSQAEIWLEVVTADVEDAANVMASAGLARRDEIEDLGPGFDGFWISSPSDTIHLVAARTQTWA